MSNTNIASLYDYALHQMAAESYFGDIALTDIERVKQTLQLGTNREGHKTTNPDLNEGYPGYTRMTARQADEFLSKFSIVHQWSDNPSVDASGNPVAPRSASEGIDGKPKLNSDILANTGLSATLIQDKTTDSCCENVDTPADVSGSDYLGGGDGDGKVSAMGSLVEAEEGRPSKHLKPEKH